MQKVFLKCFYHLYNLLRWIFFIPCDKCKQYFLYKFIVTQRLPATTMLLRSFKRVFWKKSVFYIHYLQVQNKASTSLIFSKILFADSVSCTLSHFVNVPSTLFFINEFFKTSWRHVFIKGYNKVFMTCIRSHKLFNDTHREKLCSVQEMSGWLLLIFFVCLQN